MSDPLFGNIPLTQIRPSLTNPRKRFNEASLAELADNIKKNGVAQPILVRALDDDPNQFEIIAGERRFRASKLAGLETIPAIVRVVTDAHTLELQMIENMQREDMHPIEEAEGYGRLRDEFKYTADQIADSVGKSKAYVYGRLKFLELCEAGRTAFYEDKLNASTALLIARIPIPALQEQATEEIIDEYGDGKPMSYRTARDHLQSRYMLDLADARFSITDAKLVKAAGSCTDCPKRTGAQPMIYPDIDDADVCTDPDCFETKNNAHVDKLVAACKKKGIPVYEREEAIAAAKKAGFAFHAQMHEFERVVPRINLYQGAAGTLHKDSLPEAVAYAKWHNNSLAPMFDKTALQAALEKAGICETLAKYTARMNKKLAGAEDGDGGGDDEAPNSHDERSSFARQPDARQIVAQQETTVRVAVFRAIRDAVLKGVAMELGALRALAKFLLSDFSVPSDQFDYEFEVNDESIATYIDQATIPQILVVMLDMTFWQLTQVWPHELTADGAMDEDDDNYREFISLAANCLVDVDQIRTDLTPKVDPEPEPEKSPKTKKGGSKEPKRAAAKPGSKPLDPAAAWPFPTGSRP